MKTLSNIMYAVATICCGVLAVLSFTLLRRVDVTLVFASFLLVLVGGAIGDYVAQKR